MSGDVPVDHECETGVAPTELGGAIAETGPQLAYSAENEVIDYPQPVSKARVGLIAGGIVAAAGLVAGVVFVVGRPQSTRLAPAAAPAPSTVLSTVDAQPQLPPPAAVTTVIIQAPIPPQQTAPVPPAAQPSQIPTPQQLAAWDQMMYSHLTASGAVISDYGIMAKDAHLVCARLQNGKSVSATKQEFADSARGNMAWAELFVSSAMAIYPNCP
jgi:hypothetical protein